MTAQVCIRADRLDIVRRAAGLTSNAALAKAMSVHVTTVYRTISGDAQLSGSFIAALLSAFPGITFEDLFEIVDRDVTEPAA